LDDRAHRGRVKDLCRTTEVPVPADKFNIDAPLVGRLVAAQFPQWAELPIELVEPGGWDNRTFRLGAEMSVRLPSHEAYLEQVAKEQRWLPRLAPHLPLPIPVPLAKGCPAPEFPWPWSVYRWLDGEPAAPERIADPCEFATELAQFLVALQRIDPAGGPPPGPHNFYRGGPLTVYDAETRRAIATLDGAIDAEVATEVWEAALQATWHGPPVWVHGDVAQGNLLLDDGRLSAVIDFGSSGVGDPACDATIAWTFFFGDSREAFRDRLPLDDETWARGRGWALWKALITLVALNASGAERDLAAVRFGWRLSSRQVVEEVLADHNRLA
jgi:aminoglycoside phosphotransferase (APT) family kinase protein